MVSNDAIQLMAGLTFKGSKHAFTSEHAANAEMIQEAKKLMIWNKN